MLLVRGGVVLDVKLPGSNSSGTTDHISCLYEKKSLYPSFWLVHHGVVLGGGTRCVAIVTTRW